MAYTLQKELQRLHDDTWDLVSHGGEYIEPEGVENTLGPEEVPIVRERGLYRMGLTGEELHAVAAKHAVTLGVDRENGELALSAHETAFQRVPETRELMLAVGSVLFAVIDNEGNTETTYSISDPFTIQDLDKMASTDYEGIPKEHEPGIEVDKYHALSGVVVALAANWPTILQARQDQ